MRVLWFSNTPAGGEEVLKLSGTRSGWLSSLQKAIREKVELYVAFYYARYAESFKYQGVTYIPICKKKWKYNLIKNKLFGDYVDREDLRIYLDIMNEVKPDVIHIHGTENPFGCIIGETCIPVIVSIQGSYTICNHKYYNGIERHYASIRDINIRSPYSWLFSRSWNQQYKISSIPKTRREKKNLLNCLHIIGRTDWDKRITRILAPSSVYYHNDEILRDTFYQKFWVSHSRDKVIIHTTAGESILKGFETICQALNELNKIGFVVEWRVAGIEKGCLLDKIVRKKLGRSYPLEGLILLGTLQEQDLVKKLLEADIFVMSSHIENSPNSLCEAMILGMPCISTLAGGSSSLLKDWEEGLIIQDGDPWSMAGAIIELATDKDLAVKFGRKAREKAMQRHNKDKIVNELLEIYRTILG
ncbi:MAG: glycosyltransferase family 4 protein [Bacteroidales bacterium]|nr:glycosyltransferase family 4 protein [Bacteroidales bacterium]